jgi:hypothetical protein
VKGDRVVGEPVVEVPAGERPDPGSGLLGKKKIQPDSSPTE